MQIYVSPVPIGEMSERTAGEMVPIKALISGEMSVNDIPVNPNIDIQALKVGEQDPLEVVVEVPATRSKRGWNYKPQAIQSLVNKTMEQGLPGFLGHQKPENVGSEFPTPVTHWVGAKWDSNAPIKNKNGKVIGKGKGYFRGVVDKAAGDLKRWIKAKAIRTVSIYGLPKLQKVAGETNVVDYDGLSIDWTPLGRAGMPTSIVATGEMEDQLFGELDGSYEDLKQAIREAAKVALNASNNDYVYIRKVKYDDSTAIVEYENKEGIKLFSFPYGIVDGEVKLGEKTEVVKKEVYEPVGEISNGGANKEMNWREILAQLKQMLANRDVTLAQVVGEMGITTNQIAGEIQEVKEALDAKETLEKVKESLGITGEMDVVKAAKDAAQAVTEQNKANHSELIDNCIKEKVTGEMAQKLVKRMLHVSQNATKEQITGEIDVMLKDETLKETFSKLHIDKPAGVGGETTPGTSQGLKTKRVSL